MPSASLISFTLPTKGKAKGERDRFYRELYGYDNCSYYGRYRSRVKGFLDRVPNIRYPKGMFMVSKQDTREVVRYLKGKGAQVTVWEVIPRQKESAALRLAGR